MSASVEPESIRLSPSGFKIPSFDEAFNPQQERPITELSHWIGDIIALNTTFGERNRMSGFQEVTTPTKHKYPMLGFRNGFAWFEEMGGKGYFAEVFTYDDLLPSPQLSLLRVEHSPMGQQARYRVVEFEKELFNDYEEREDFARATLRPIVRGLLTELDYGEPVERYADILPFPSLQERTLR